MKKAALVIRVLMGILFLVFGLNGFFNFIPMPPMQGASADFVGLLIVSKLLYVVHLIEIFCGTLLLSGFYIPLALLVLAPIIFNIFWFHLMLAPEGAPLGVVLLGMELFLLWNHKKAFSSLLKKK